MDRAREKTAIQNFMSVFPGLFVFSNEVGMLFSKLCINGIDMNKTRGITSKMSFFNQSKACDFFYFKEYLCFFAFNADGWSVSGTAIQNFMGVFLMIHLFFQMKWEFCFCFPNWC